MVVHQPQARKEYNLNTRDHSRMNTHRQIAVRLLAQDIRASQQLYWFSFCPYQEVLQFQSQQPLRDHLCQ